MSLAARRDWPWLLVLAGGVLIVALAVQSYGAYSALDGMHREAQTTRSNPLELFDDVATNGVRVPSGIDSRNRAQYERSQSQFLLAGTGVCLGLTCVAGGLFLHRALAEPHD